MSHQERATFAGGCFWCTEADFRKLLGQGVLSTSVGYMGGHVDQPTYKQVCTDTTGHAEVVDVTFDPAVISYEALVKLFFDVHNPTTLNRQGPDFGSQYRSAIFTHSAEQARVAEQVKADLQASGRFERPIVTIIEPALTYYPAEDYHQQYYEKQQSPQACKF